LVPANHLAEAPYAQLSLSAAALGRGRGWMMPKRCPSSKSSSIKIIPKMEELNSKIEEQQKIHYKLQLDYERLQKDVESLEKVLRDGKDSFFSALTEIKVKEEKCSALKAEIKNLQGKQERIGSDGSRMNNTRRACEERRDRLDSDFHLGERSHFCEIEAAQKHAPSLLNLSNEADFAQLATMLRKIVGN